MLDDPIEASAHWLRRDELDNDIIEKTPILKEFFSKDIQDTVGEVSDYSKCGIGEFIAETYAGLVGGKKYSENVMKLFNRYSGGLV